MSSLVRLPILVLALTAVRSFACDLCGCAMPNHPWEPRAGFYLGTAEQFTNFGTIQVDGREINNGARQYLDSSITQVFLGYNFTRALGLQLNVPLILSGVPPHRGRPNRDGHGVRPW